MSDKNIFERVDGVENKVNGVSKKMDDISQKLDKLLNAERTGSEQSGGAAKRNKDLLRRFITSAKKEYVWLGTQADFEENKAAVIKKTLLLILILVLSTVFTSVAYHSYSFYTLLENVWLLMMIFTLCYVCRADRFYECFEFSMHSNYNFYTDLDGVDRKGEPKKKYNVMLCITCICAVCNIIVIWLEGEAITALFATAFEILTFIFSIYVYKINILEFFNQYVFIKFYSTVPNGKGGYQRICLIYDEILNKMYTEEDFKKTHTYY